MTEHPLRALIVDWGGVLTTGLQESMIEWADADGIDYEGYLRTIFDWLGEPGSVGVQHNPIFALERGELTTPDFEERLASRLRTRDGSAVPAEGLLDRMFAHFRSAPHMSDVVREARTAGIRTALLSNSWGNDYPRDGWDQMFDVVVISGEVGMRKPEPGIFGYTLDELGTAAGETVFVDDLPVNVRAAAALGLVGVVHRSYEETVTELEALFDRPLRPGRSTPG